MTEDDQNERLAAGAKLIPTLTEVMPQDADERIGLIYDDIRAVLRVPFVNFIFRILANDPDFLSAAWTNFSPLMRTAVLEQAADEVRSAALPEPVPAAEGIEWPALGDLTRIRPFTDTIHYVLPKLLLTAAAFDEGLDESAEPRGGMDVPAAEIPRGVAKGATSISMVDPTEATGRLAALFQDIKERHRHPGVASYYRSIGRWPDFLEAAWNLLKPLIDSPRYEERKKDVIEKANRAIVNSSWPSMLWTRAFKTLNLNRDHIERIRAILAVFRFRLIPDLLIDVSVIKAMLDGPSAARFSRFSAGKKTYESR